MYRNFKIMVRRWLWNFIRWSRYTIDGASNLAHFKERLAIEKRRAERANTRFSVLVFNLKKYLNHLTQNETPFVFDQIQYLLKKITADIRKTDTVCAYQLNYFLVLLPDTYNSGAQSVSHRIMNRLLALQSDYAHSQALTENDIDLEILAFPEKENGSTILNEIESTAADATPSDRRADSTPDLAFTNSFHKTYLETLNCSQYVFNGSSLALPLADIIFWDQQVVSKFLVSLKHGIKRGLDLLGALVGLTLLSPLLAGIAVLIKITSPGPILFKQRRVGYKGHYFTFLKFRSMFQNCPDQAHADYVRKLIHGDLQAINNGSSQDPYYKITNDCRITPLGKFLRKTSIDELPQLWNVLKGEMSLVGPRPPIQYEVSEYQNWHYRRISIVKPGITGLWQVSGRNHTSFDQMVRLDIQYAEHWTIGLDLKILFKTFKAVFDGN
ncbi:sugar transferase [candidate division KSB1 bacterium]|nr:sugar transferase [candidate division KSB1 bacterium]